MKRILLVCLTAVLIHASNVLWAQDVAVAGKITSSEDGSGLARRKRCGERYH